MLPANDDDGAPDAEALALLRSISVSPSPALVAITQRRVREHALRLQESHARRWGIAVSSVIAATMTIASSVSVWRVLADLGWAGSPWIWAPVLGCAWFLPGVLAGAAAWAAAGTVAMKGAVTQ